MFLPVINNLLFEVNFSRNDTISAYFAIFNRTTCSYPIMPTSRPVFATDSLQKLLTIIDNNCKDPSRSVPSMLSKNSFSALLTTGRMSDFTISVGSKVFPVHRTVLAINSSVFLTMFETSLSEKNSKQLIITDFSEEAFEEFLKCLYSQASPEATHAMEIFAIAARYDVSPLKSKCEDIILDNLDEGNALEIFSFAHLYNLEGIKIAAFREIKSRFKGFIVNNSLMHDPLRLKLALEFGMRSSPFSS